MASITEHQLISPIPAPTTYERSASHMKQYGSVWIYKAAFAGAALGQGLGKWEVTLGSAVAGLVASYAFCYFWGNSDPLVTPEDVTNLSLELQSNENKAALALQEQNAANVVIKKDEKVAKDFVVDLESGLKTLIQDDSKLIEIVEEEKKNNEEIAEINSQIIQDTQIVQRNIVEISTENRDLKAFNTKGQERSQDLRAFLEQHSSHQKGEGK